MNWEMIFTITNNFALVMWLILAFAPRKDIVLKGLFYGGAGLLALTYAVIVIPLTTGMIEGGAGASPDFTTLAGVQALLASDGGATIGWVHYLAFDLFVGLWIARDGDAKKISRLIQAPILLATFIAGPVGLLVWLAVREPAARRNGRWR